MNQIFGEMNMIYFQENIQMHAKNNFYYDISMFFKCQVTQGVCPCQFKQLTHFTKCKPYLFSTKQTVANQQIGNMLLNKNF